ncbi:protein eceriferum 26 [Phtheirospermum japonicum]|uniref:Protein eceriferum 26 n=1 Tax=Phtheirospermum japonicum TaxID=374723 RepID=A0A830CBX1_9LAMI|nr:protein eceriferum 26 [Phtheirospermum japonicum]
MEQEKLRRVKLESKLSVVSSTPTEPGKIHKFSLLDQAMGLHTIHLVFYYRSNPFNNGPLSTDLDNLRVSLSELLDLYPTATGRLTRGPDGGWQVKCNDAGVRMLQASVSTTLDEWLGSADACEEQDLTMWEDMPRDPTFWSPFRIQINNFKCGALAIGLSCSHIHADLTSAALLIKSWAQLHRAQPLTHSPTIHLPQLPTTITSQTATAKNITADTPPPKPATTTFKFPASAIEKHLSQVRNRCPNATPFDILVALFWSRIAHSHGALSICIDSRNNRSPIPYAYFGNAFRSSVLSVGPDVLAGGDLGQISECVHQHVEGLKGEDFPGSLLGEGPELRIYGPRLTCIDINSAKPLVMYGAEFEEGQRPVHVSCRVGNVEAEGMIMVMPSAEGGLGRTVTVTLPHEQIDGLCEDQIIKDLEPTMIISGKRS